MKIRNGFVSNSSSASFTIRKNNLSGRQIDSIRLAVTPGGYAGKPFFTEFGFIGQLKFDGPGKYGDVWEIREDLEYIYGDTTMDNGDAKAFFERLGIAPEDVEFDGENYYEFDEDW